MSQDITFILAAGQTKRVNVTGNYYRIVKAAEAVWLSINGTIEVQRSMGMAEEFREDFTQLQVMSDIAQTVTIAVSGSGVLHDSRVSVVGNVATVVANKSTAGNQFFFGQQITALAGLYCGVQLWNPAASGLNVVISRLGVASKFSNLMYFEFQNAQLAVPSITLDNKRSSGAKSNSNVTLNFFSAALLASRNKLPTDPGRAPTLLPFGDAPLVIEPGYGLTVAASIVSDDIIVIFDFQEQSV